MIRGWDSGRGCQRGPNAMHARRARVRTTRKNHAYAIITRQEQEVGKGRLGCLLQNNLK